MASTSTLEAFRSAGTSPMRAATYATMNTAGDLLFRMEGDLTLEIFNFTAFEIWEVTFSDGTSQLSNYAVEGGTR